MPRWGNGLQAGRRRAQRCGSTYRPGSVRAGGAAECGVSPRRGKPALLPKPGSGSVGVWADGTRLPEPGVFGSSGGGGVISQNDTKKKHRREQWRGFEKSTGERVSVPINAVFGPVQEHPPATPACFVRWRQVTGGLKPSWDVVLKPSPESGLAKPLAAELCAGTRPSHG